jgi:hypothetical protein
VTVDAGQIGGVEFIRSFPDDSVGVGHDDDPKLAQILEPSDEIEFLPGHLRDIVQHYHHRQPAPDPAFGSDMPLGLPGHGGMAIQDPTLREQSRDQSLADFPGGLGTVAEDDPTLKSARQVA